MVWWRGLALWCVGLVLWGCQRVHSGEKRMDCAKCSVDAEGVVRWPAQARSGGSSRFWKHWGDGRAELSSYRAQVERYGVLRDAEVVKIFVTEPMDRRTWIKDDGAPRAQQVQVLKLNQMIKFQTGIYPYSVMTSTFSPAGRWRSEAFAPAKITLTAQEWCGHVFEGLWAGPDQMMTRVRSYFSSEGEKTAIQKIDVQTLYEDALWIQLREWEGPFAQGKSWRGPVVPSLWRVRKKHIATAPIQGEIQREEATREGAAVRRFTLRYAGYWKRIDIEAAWPHRVLGWSASDGEKATLQGSKRLAYWMLNGPKDTGYRKQIGLKE